MLIKYIIIYIFCAARGKFCVMNKKYFKSGIFKKMFSSYIIIILLLFVSFVSAMLYEAWTISMERQENYYQSAVEKISNSIDVLLMDAYVITSDINSSDVINKYAIKNSVSEAEVMTEIKNYMISRYNINIYDVLLMLNDSDSAFSSFGIFRLDKAADNIQVRGKVHSGKSVNDIYDIGNSEVVFNKEFIIYTQNYNSVYAKGVICVLYDKKSLIDMIDSQITHDMPINIYINDEPAYSYGDVKKPIEYNVSSVFNTAHKLSKKEKINWYDASAMLSSMGWYTHTDTYGFYEDHIKPYVNIKKLKRIVSKHSKKGVKNNDVRMVSVRKHGQADRVGHDIKPDSGLSAKEHRRADQEGH